MASAAGYNNGSLYSLNNDFNLLVVEGNIIHQDADVMVNLITPDFDTETGYWCRWKNNVAVAAAYKECKSKAPEDLEMGEYVVTSYSKSADPSADPESEPRYVYNWACVDSRFVDLQLYTQALVESFEIANAMELSSIAVPVLDREDMFLNDNQPVPPNEEIASKICNEILTLSQAHPLDVKTVKLVVHGQDDENLSKIYRAALNKLNALESMESTSPTNDPTVPEPQTHNAGTKDANAKGLEEPSPLLINRGIDQSDSPATSPSFPSRSASSENAQVYMIQSSNKSADPSPGPSPSPSRGQGARPKGKKSTTSTRNRDNKIRSDGRSNPANGTVDVLVRIGDLTAQHVDAIVHPTSYIGNYIDLKGKVGKALELSAGPDFKSECSNRAREHSAQSQTAITGAGKLPCKKIIHVNITYMDSQDDWVGLILRCLCVAENIGASSVALPAIGKAIDPVEFKAVSFQQAIGKFKETKPMNLEKIHIILLDKSALDAFNEIVLYSSPPNDESKDQTNKNIDVFSSRDSKTSMMDYNTMTYNGVRVVVKEGDISLEKADCVVHGAEAVNNYNTIPTSDPVGEALYQRGGTKYHDECFNKEFIKGSRVITKGGKMHCTNILHIDTTDYVVRDTWGNFIVDALKVADKYGMAIVSFPLIEGTRSDVKSLSRTQMAGVEVFLNTSSTLSIKEIRFVIHRQENALKAYQEALQYLGKYTVASTQAKTNATGAQQQVVQNAQQPSAIKLKVIEGNIAKLSCDMIVHGTTSGASSIPLEDKVGKVLAKAAGQKFTDACSKTCLPPGKCVLTCAGDLKCKDVLHVDVSDMTDKQTWTHRFYQILLMANAVQATTLALPPLGATVCGKAGWKTHARIIKDTIDKFSNTRSPVHLQTVQIVIWQNRLMYDDFVDVISQGATGGHTCKGDQISVKGNGNDFAIQVDIGDITKENTDAIVHATNERWSFSGSRVGKAIADTGGQGLIDSRNSVRSRHYGRRPITIITKSGSLPCKHVVHVDMTHHSNMEEKIIACLKEVSSANLNSIAFPALGTGTMKGDVRSIALSFKNAIKTFSVSTKQNKINLIKIVIFEDYMQSQFLDILKTI